MTVSLVLSYAEADTLFRDALVKHSAPLVAAGRVCLWHAGLVKPGAESAHEIEKQFGAAVVIVLLISADYVADKREEMTTAIKGARAGAHIVPVLIRPCHMGLTALASFKSLPSDGTPVSLWLDRDLAWTGIVAALDALLDIPPEPPLPTVLNASNPLPAAAVLSTSPKRTDDEALTLLADLEDARVRRQRAHAAGAETAEIDGEIRALKRRIREGGRLRPGDFLGDRYTLLRRLGRGGFATVWEAEDRELHERVAIKVLHPNLAEDAERRDRFFRGARVMAELLNEAVVRIHMPEGKDGGFHYFVMELVAGGDLHSAVLEGRFPRDRTIRLILRLGEALAETHTRGYIHRDVKPANVLLDAENNPKLADFDLVGGDETTGGTRTGAMGSFVYAAPEVLSRPQEADRRADVFGLGMTALFCLSSKTLTAEDFRDPKRVLKDLRRPALAAVIGKAIQWKPADRFQDIRSFCEALRKAAKSERQVDARDAGEQRVGHSTIHSPERSPATSVAAEVFERDRGNDESDRELMFSLSALAGFEQKRLDNDELKRIERAKREASASNAAGMLPDSSPSAPDQLAERTSRSTPDESPPEIEGALEESTSRRSDSTDTARSPSQLELPTTLSVQAEPPLPADGHPDTGTPIAPPDNSLSGKPPSQLIAIQNVGEHDPLAQTTPSKHKTWIIRSWQWAIGGGLAVSLVALVALAITSKGCEGHADVNPSDDVFVPTTSTGIPVTTSPPSGSSDPLKYKVRGCSSAVPPRASSSVVAAQPAARPTVVTFPTSLPTTLPTFLPPPTAVAFSSTGTLVVINASGGNYAFALNNEVYPPLDSRREFRLDAGNYIVRCVSLAGRESTTSVTIKADEPTTVTLLP